MRITHYTRFGLEYRFDRSILFAYPDTGYLKPYNGVFTLLETSITGSSITVHFYP